MFTGTKRDVVEILADGEAAPTDIADELDVSVQTVHRHLQSLREDGYVRKSGKRAGTTRPYTLYAIEETGHLFSVRDGKVAERTLDLGDVQKLLFSILEVPQETFHLPLLSYLVDPPGTMDGIEAVAVYGPVARGDATEDNDVDLLFVTEDDDATLPDAPAVVPASFDAEARGPEGFEDDACDSDELDGECVVTIESVTRPELREAVERDDELLWDAVRESITLYDPDGVLRDAKSECESGTDCE